MQPISKMIMDTVLDELLECPEGDRLYLRKIARLSEIDWSALSPEWKWRFCNAKLINNVFEWDGWEFRSLRNGMIPYVLPHWHGEYDNLFIFGEQGIGDEVMFMSVLPDVISYFEGSGKTITVECDGRLESILARSFPEVTFHGRTGTFMDPVDHEGCEYQIPMGDLVRFFRNKERFFTGEAYIIPDPARVAELKPIFGGRIGKSWRGRTSECKPGELPGEVNLQYDYWPTEVEDLMTPAFNLKNDIEGLFALISVLDEIHCVPTSIAHFAGAMGKKCTVYMDKEVKENFKLNWRFGKSGDSMVWHKSIKVVR